MSEYGKPIAMGTAPQLIPIGRLHVHYPCMPPLNMNNPSELKEEDTKPKKRFQA